LRLGGLWERPQLPQRDRPDPDRQTLSGAPKSVWRSGFARTRWGSLDLEMGSSSFPLPSPALPSLPIRSPPFRLPSPSLHLPFHPLSSPSPPLPFPCLSCPFPVPIPSPSLSLPHPYPFGGGEGRGRDEPPISKSKLPQQVRAEPDRQTLFGAPESVWRSGSARSRWWSLERSPDPPVATKGFYF